VLDVKGYPGDVVQKRGEVPPGLNRKCLREERPTASDSSHGWKPRETWGGRMATAAATRKAAPHNAGYGHGWHARKRRIKIKGKSHRVKGNKTKQKNHSANNATENFSRPGVPSVEELALERDEYPKHSYDRLVARAAPGA